MPKTPYTKPALSLHAQLQQLKARGMQIDDENQALHYLGHLNYYRLGAYWLPFEKDHANHEFHSGTAFGDALIGNKGFSIYLANIRLIPK